MARQTNHIQAGWTERHRPGRDNHTNFPISEGTLVVITEDARTTRDSTHYPATIVLDSKVHRPDSAYIRVDLDTDPPTTLRLSSHDPYKSRVTVQHFAEDLSDKASLCVLEDFAVDVVLQTPNKLRVAVLAKYTADLCIFEADLAEPASSITFHRISELTLGQGLQKWCFIPGVEF
ncbi:hypothetical protein HKX48_008254 [Thoreauomyces humboldtii]|nr:hypothetical protein HKX48_008254 [Thoreauomyces humboldtii]